MNSLPRRDFLKKVGIAGAGLVFSRWAWPGAHLFADPSRISLAYGDSPLAIDTPAGLLEVLRPNPHPALKDLGASVHAALAGPTGSASLADRVGRGKKIVLAISDRTRVFPQAQILDFLLEYLLGEAGVHPKDISFAVGNGNHAVDPLHHLDVSKALREGYPFVNFNSRRYEHMKNLGKTEPADEDFLARTSSRAWTAGTLNTGGSFMAGIRSLLSADPDGFARSVHGGPLVETGFALYASGGSEIWIEEGAAKADLVIGVGHIKPHPLTGYSGGVKAIAPGIMGRRGIVANHMLQAHPSVGLGNVEENILRLDLERGCAFLPNVFIVNAITNAEGEAAGVVAGDPVEAHRAGVAVAEKIARVPARRADIVVYSNKTQGRMNLYQLIKSMAAAKALVQPGGVLIAVGELPDGVGSRMQINPAVAVKEVYYHYNYRYRMPGGVDTVLVCRDSRRVASGTFFIPAESVDKALLWARRKVGKDATVSVIPDTDMVLPQAPPPP